MFIDQWNGIGLFLSPLWETSNTLSLFTNVSGSLGYGGFFQNRWFQGQWLPSQQLGQPGISTLWQELYAINVACHLWGALWTSKCIQFYCDNQGVLEVINSRRSKVPGNGLGQGPYTLHLAAELLFSSSACPWDQ